jgi:quercetin 2,3-dioxygenase
MQLLRRSNERGLADFGWLKSRHTFSFGHYHDPNHMGFGVLRVINEDRVAPGAGFDTHSHRDMEIISYVIDGALAHKDSLGGGSIIRPGELQRMSAGTGILHSEYNHSNSDPVHFFQIWIVPERGGVEPGYAQKSFSEVERQGRLRLMASRDGRGGALTLHQDVDFYGALLKSGETLSFKLRPARLAWIQLARGALDVNGLKVSVGDGLGLGGVTTITISATKDAELILFDLPA